MSSKSILLIDLKIEKDFSDHEELKKLKAFSGHKIGFAGWTYWGHIGTVYNIAENYESLFTALDSAGDAYLPIICNFKEIKNNQ